MLALSIIIDLSSFRLYIAVLSCLVKLLNLLEGISISNNLSSKQLRCVLITASLLLRLKVDLGLNLSWENGLSSYAKWHINIRFLPCSSSSYFNFAWSILLAVGTSLSPFDKRDFSAEDTFLLERFITFLPTNLHSGLFPLKVATFSLSTFIRYLANFTERRFLCTSYFILFCILLTNSVMVFWEAWKNSPYSFLELLDSFKLRRLWILSKSSHRNSQKDVKLIFNSKRGKCSVNLANLTS